MELALEAGVSPRHLSFLESGRAEPGRDVVAKLAAALDIPETARSALFAAAGFSPLSQTDAATRCRLQLLERMLLNWDPHPSALTDSQGCVLATNVGMRALHASLTGIIANLQALSAAELALGEKGFGPYLKNLQALRQRFAHCRALEQLIEGVAVDALPPRADGPVVNEMLFADEFGGLAFGLVEVVEGHPLHGPAHAVRIYSMVPSDRKTEAAMAAMIAHHRPADPWKVDKRSRTHDSKRPAPTHALRRSGASNVS